MTRAHAVSVRLPEHSWAFASWTAARLRWFFAERMCHDVCPLFGVVYLRPPAVWSSVEECVRLWDVPARHMDHATARQLERIADRMEAAERPCAWHLVEGVGVDRLLGLACLGSVCRAWRGLEVKGGAPCAN